MYIDPPNKKVRFVQITKADGHSLKLEYFHQLMDNLKEIIETEVVEIFFLVPMDRLDSFAVGQITGSGLLAQFRVHADTSMQWVKNQEEKFVEVAGMESV